MQTIHASPYAGQWYPADSLELRDLIAEVLSQSVIRTSGFVRAGGIGFVAPHAAPVYSGPVAAAAYRHIEKCRPRRVVLLGFSHGHRVDGIAAPRMETISTPLGVSEIDVEASRALAGHPPFHATTEDYPCDHSVEIQLPFLQTVAPDAKILPLYVGRLDPEQRAAAARRLRWLLNDATVLVASSDLTHYGREFGYLPFPVDENTGEHLRTLDGEVISAAGSLDPEILLEQLHGTGSTVCGSGPMALLLEVLRGAGGEELFQETLDYQTSGEIAGDYAHSVSYAALGYFRSGAFLIGADAQRALLDSARRTLDLLQTTGQRHRVEAAMSPELAQRLGAFVTLYQRGELRGCIGRCHEPEPLALSVPRLTLSAALEDDRFEPLRPLEPARVEISLLSPFKRIRFPRQLIAGEHGGFLERGARVGLLLPKVATERGWNTSRFLEALANKAGLPDDIYEDPAARLYVFRTQDFGDA